jgi:riboflavin synthase
MFTGLIEATGEVARVDIDGDGARIGVETPLGRELAIGDSIAVNGVCLTAAAVDASGFAAVLSPETRRVTTLGRARVGQVVNLERPLRADGRIGGHFVLGHVDGMGRLAGIRADGESYWLDIDVVPALEPLLVPKGSIAIDGISLTIARLDGARIGVQIVPHTWSHTALSAAREGDAVNLEADVLGKYVARLVARGERG